MLVLSRQRDETIMIGDDIEVTVVDIRGDKVRLGINAPKSISVHRKEVYDAIRRENREAAQVKPEDLSGLGKIGPKDPGKNEEKKLPKENRRAVAANEQSLSFLLCIATNLSGLTNRPGQGH